jgi:hypothetical protein
MPPHPEAWVLLDPCRRFARGMAVTAGKSDVVCRPSPANFRLHVEADG